MCSPILIPSTALALALLHVHRERVVVVILLYVRWMLALFVADREKCYGRMRPAAK